MELNFELELELCIRMMWHAARKSRYKLLMLLLLLLLSVAVPGSQLLNSPGGSFCPVHSPRPHIELIKY